MMLIAECYLLVNYQDFNKRNSENSIILRSIM